MNYTVGILLLVFSSILTGAALGGLFGFFFAAINNLIMGPYFGAADGSYRWWAVFLSQVWACVFGLIALSWGLFLAYKGPSIPGTLD